ncbi:MAG: ankyrin repeat domain-containing protein, partial [Planctomycetota bacterium]
PFENGKGHHIWDMINASITGDLGRIRLLVEACPSLVNCYYDYQTPLHLAVAYGHSNVVKYLLEQGADVAGENYPFHDSLLVSARDRQDSQIVELLSKAVRKRFPYYEPGPHSIINDVASGNVKAVQNRLSNSSNHCNVCEEDGNTPLHVAARNLDVALVALLLGRGADANAANKEGFKPIHVALYRNNYWYHRENGWECAELLLRHTEPNINLAATFGDLERVRNSLRNEPKLANFCDSCDKRPISSAAARGHVGIVRVLLDAGADVTLAEANAPNGFALWAAARGGHIDCARLLLEAGANPHAPVESSGTAFTAAEGNKLLLDLLRQYAREPTEPDPEESDGLDPVSGAIMRNDIDSLRCFLDKDPTLVRNPAAFYGEGYLAFAASRRNMGIVDLLLERGARVPDRSNWGAAYAFKHNDVARKLLEHGASPNHRNWLERTVLHEFSYRGYLDKLELLIEFGAEVNAIDMEYQSTPLGFAARGGQTDAVELLLKAGADPELPSSPVWARPKAWAQSRGHSDLSRTLQSNKQ